MQDLTGSIRDLLQTCADSAAKTLAILCALAENNMLDSFLPFDLEFTSSAASVLIILDDILRIIPISTSVKRRGSRILLDMKQRGSVPAQLRQNELDRLNRLARRLWERFPTSMTGSKNKSRNSTMIQDQPSSMPEPGLTLGPTSNPQLDQNPAQSSDIVANPSYDQNLSSPFQTQNTTPFDLISPDLAEQFELSQEQMLFVADQLNADADDALFMSNLDFGAPGGASGSGNNWLWSMS